MPTAKPLPPVERLRSLYDYEPASGALISKYQGRRHPITKTDGQKGYLRVRISGINYSVARIVWKLMTGRDPPPLIDHANGVTTDNRWENLREATTRQNSYNTKVNSRNTARLKGTRRARHLNSGVQRWGAKIFVDGRNVHLGTFNTAEEAHEAYKAAALKHFGAFARF